MLKNLIQLHIRQSAELPAAPAARQWLEQLPAALAALPDAAALQRLYSTAARSLQPLSQLPRQLQPELERAGAIAPLDWRPGDIGRLLLLLSLPESRDGQAHPCFARLYRGGDAGEQQSLLRALPLLPAPERHLSLAIDACRSHIQGCFEAIACENGYPARFFPELNFNQMVLKALFTRTPLSRIHGLRHRLTPQLRRMAADLASERQATQADIPDDVYLILKGSLHENV
ncbi:EboA domain-containing protein [Chromobacterium subtsugae]|uniref:EboA domain-containing protein n=1 Tax=Chromobacterium subtsugae TaxID=251747 RepID=UPI00069BFB48|nr:EboA domain-containing protein [Chromobacterium subtsugae]